jgi:hypothetical protein
MKHKTFADVAKKYSLLNAIINEDLCCSDSKKVMSNHKSRINFSQEEISAREELRDRLSKLRLDKIC